MTKIISPTTPPSRTLRHVFAYPNTMHLPKENGRILLTQTSLPSLQEMSLLHSHICTAVGDPKRMLILYALHEQPRHVTALAGDLGLPQPTVSRHLRVLRQRALVVPERNGAAVNYRLADDSIITILESMRRLLRDALARQTEMLDEDE